MVRYDVVVLDDCHEWDEMANSARLAPRLFSGQIYIEGVSSNLLSTTPPYHQSSHLHTTIPPYHQCAMVAWR